MSRPVVIVMTKAPQPGFVKTRLSPPLAAEDAAELAACFAQDTVAKVKTVVPDVIVAYAPADAHAALEPLLPARVIWLEQRGDNLGARLASVAEEAHALGFSPFVIVGTDSPTFPPEFVETALRALAAGEADVALGATDDGGYYLVGLHAPVADLFQNVAWSTPLAYEDTMRNAARLGLRLFNLPRWYDVDTPRDLLRLRDELRDEREAHRRAPHTRRWLSARRALLSALERTA